MGLTLSEESERTRGERLWRLGMSLKSPDQGDGKDGRREQTMA